MPNSDLEKNNRYLFFKLDDEIYAISAYNILEVVDYKAIRKVPQTNSSIKGVTNIRGELIAVVDPKIRLENRCSTISKRTSFVIMKIFDKVTNEEVSIALMVDMILEVGDIPKVDVLPAPEFGTKIDERFIKNIIKYENGYVTVLKISLVLDIHELSIKG